MRKIGSFFFFILIFCSCSKTKNGCQPAKHEYKFFANKTIDTTRLAIPSPDYTFYSWQINSGANMVFQYKYLFEDCPQIADDEGMRTILFEVPASTTHFRFEDSIQLQTAKSIVALSCECAPSYPVLFTKGWIEGNKISEKKWNVKADIKAPWNPSQSIKFEAVFNWD